MVSESRPDGPSAGDVLSLFLLQWACGYVVFLWKVPRVLRRSSPSGLDAVADGLVPPISCVVFSRRPRVFRARWLPVIARLLGRPRL